MSNLMLFPLASARPLAAMTICLTTLAHCAIAGPASFNETDIEAALDLSGYGDDLRSHAGSLLGLPSHPRAPLDAEAALEGLSIEQVAMFILDSVGSAAVVYPSECYFYFRFNYFEHRIAGNFRFTDIEQGQLHIAYYDIGSPYEYTYATLIPGQTDAESGRLPVRIIVDRDDRAIYADIQIAGSRAAFAIPDPMSLPGAIATQVTPADAERHVTALLDESGYFLHLMYYEPERMLYYIRDPAARAPETLVPVQSSETLPLLIGQRSRFVFFDDTERNRQMLVGVARQSILDNDPYDGPFDQIPPRLDLREMLEAAYPYVKDRGGIDQHGVFQGLEGQRVAISPYQAYDTIPGLIETLEALLDSDREGLARIVQMAYEPKRDFRTPAMPSMDQHEVPVSATYPREHQQRRSRSWPPNHQYAFSASILGSATDPAPEPSPGAGVTPP